MHELQLAKEIFHKLLLFLHINKLNKLIDYNFEIRHYKFFHHLVKNLNYSFSYQQKRLSGRKYEILMFEGKINDHSIYQIYGTIINLQYYIKVIILHQAINQNQSIIYIRTIQIAYPSKIQNIQKLKKQINETSLNNNVFGRHIFQIVEAQRGGGSSHSHSSSSHSSSRSRSNYHFRSYYPSPQTSQIDYATNLWDDLHMLIIILGSFIGIGVSAALISNYLENKRMKHQWQLFKSGQSIRNQIIDIDAMIQKIKKQNWRMEYKIDVESDNEPHPVQIFSIKISNKKEQIQDELELHLKGNDSVGSWEGNGIIKFSKPILLQFKKEYLNKEQAGQTGKWKNLIYEGIFQEQQQLFIGKWYYLGLEKDQQFSGVWQIQLIEK